MIVLVAQQRKTKKETKFKETGDTKYTYKNELGKAFFSA